MADNCDLYGYVICDKLNNSIEPLARQINSRQIAMEAVLSTLSADTSCIHTDIKDIMNSIDILKRRSITIMQDTGRIWEKVKDMDSTSIGDLACITQLAGQVSQLAVEIGKIQDQNEDAKKVLNSLKTDLVSRLSTVNNNIGLLSSDMVLKLQNLENNITEM